MHGYSFCVPSEAAREVPVCRGQRPVWGRREAWRRAAEDVREVRLQGVLPPRSEPRCHHHLPVHHLAVVRAGTLQGLPQTWLLHRGTQSHGVSSLLLCDGASPPPHPSALSTLTVDEASCPPGAALHWTELWKVLTFTHFGHHTTWIISHVCFWVHTCRSLNICSKVYFSFYFLGFKEKACMFAEDIYILTFSLCGKKNHSKLAVWICWWFCIGDGAVLHVHRFMWDKDRWS